jgi:LacI family transcriptional regulator
MTHQLQDKPSFPTIRDVARRAGVSVATVSRVLNRTAVIAPQTEQRVRAAIDELNFVPRAAAQNLSNRKTNVIGLLLPEIGWDNFFPPMLRGIEAGCYDHGFEVLIYSTHHPASTRELHRTVGEHNTDGLLLFTDCLSDEEIVRLNRRGFPLVLLHRSPPDGLDIPHVVFENKAGARRMVDHLLDVHGYRRIAFLTGQENNEDALWRLRGYQEALETHSLPFDPSLVRSGGFSETIAQHTVTGWLAQGLTCDAIFAADDDSAYGALNALQQAGWRVPQDMPVVGFDDSPTSRLLSPPLTTVRAPIEEAGYQAAEMLAALIHTGHAPSQLLLPTELVVRRSCGCL